MKTKTVTLAMLFAATLVARANIIPLGQVTFTGDFTLNHLYNFNDPGSQPFGWFQTQTVQSSTGIFAPFIQAGNQLGGAHALWSQGQLPVFTIGGFDFQSFFVNITGADSGRFVFGETTIAGNGFHEIPDSTVTWSFIAPPYDISNFPDDVTGPISFGIVASFDNHHVPDTGNASMLLGFATSALLLVSRKKRFSAGSC
jgi:hypothetical protein